MGNDSDHVNDGPIEWISVADYGAVGDGRTDDTDALQSALADADGGGLVYIPPGTYVTNELETGSRTAIVGEGPDTTTLRLSDDAPPDARVLVIDQEEFVTVSTLGVDGNGRRTDQEFDILGEGIEMDSGARYLWVDTVHVHDTLGEGIDVDTNDRVWITGSVVEKCAGNGIHVSDPGLEHVFISDCWVENCAHERANQNSRFGGLAIRGANIYVSNVIIRECAAGVDIENIARESFIGISNCQLQSNAAPGVHVYGDLQDSRVSIGGCRIRTDAVDRSAVRVDADSDDGTVSISECQIRKPMSGTPCVTRTEQSDCVVTLSACDVRGGSTGIAVESMDVSHATLTGNSRIDGADTAVTARDAARVLLVGNRIENDVLLGSDRNIVAANTVTGVVKGRGRNDAIGLNITNNTPE